MPVIPFSNKHFQMIHGKTCLLFLSLRILLIVVGICINTVANAVRSFASIDNLPNLEIVHQNLLTIQGHVTDETGNPISRAILTVKWTERETSSDVNGEFKIENVTEKDTIVVMHAGYHQVEFAVEKSKLNYFIGLKTASKAIAGQPVITHKVPTIDITGKVYDDKGAGLPNSFLIVRGQNQGGFTNSKGEFSLAQIPVGSAIIISHVSFLSEEFIVKKGEAGYQRTLRKNPMLLDEVVVVGYSPTRDADNKKLPEHTEKRFIVVEQNPEFPGGTQALYKFLAQNLKYPTEASSNNRSGSVLVSFTINEDGNIQNAQIIKSLGYGIDQEILRVILSMPRWTPAKQNGEAVSKEFTLPVNFSLE